tara:strand:+ start:300 stop:656 length:357 start_codon:yes stop_codon:yes gene_type:complete
MDSNCLGFVDCDVNEFFNVKKVGLCKKWTTAPVYFMITKRGQSIEIHIGAKGRDGKRQIRAAGMAIIEYIRQKYTWCKMIIATVALKSVYNLCVKLGFKDLGRCNRFTPPANVMVIKL